MNRVGIDHIFCLSHGIVNKYSNVAIFASISNTERVYPFYVELQGTNTTGKVLLDQLVTIDFDSRGFRYVENIPDGLLVNLLGRVKALFELEKIEFEGLKLFLSLYLFRL